MKKIYKTLDKYMIDTLRKECERLDDENKMLKENWNYLKIFIERELEYYRGIDKESKSSTCRLTRSELANILGTMEIAERGSNYERIN